jgi:hypothetical protein
MKARRTVKSNSLKLKERKLKNIKMLPFERVLEFINLLSEFENEMMNISIERDRETECDAICEI